MGWIEVAAGCFARRYEPFDVTVGVIVGGEGVLVVDTRASLAEAAELREHVERLTSTPVRWVVNTHWHFDHCFGNAEFGDEAATELWAHETVPGMLIEHATSVRQWLASQGGAWADAMDALVVAPPRQTMAGQATIDIGGRTVELIHPGRGHTDGDVVVRITDADVLYAGDLVEQSGPPAFGDDSYPLDWPATLDRVLELLTGGTAVVPGHGAVVDKAFVAAQRAEIGVVAGTIGRLAMACFDVSDALSAVDWPYSADALADAVRRGFAQLAASAAE